MFLHIDPSNGLAIYDQIVRQIKFAIARGAVEPGCRVPSVRELARELALNPNTVARAYQQLQTEGVLQPVRGIGLEVAADALQQCQQERRTLVQQRLRAALEEARQSGFAGDSLRQMVGEQLDSVFDDGR